jgi:hypothetical protein
MKKEVKFYYVYITTNLINNHQYVGDRECNCKPEKDKYLGSGTLFEQKVIEYGKENFKKEILDDSFKTRQEAFDAQAKYIIEYNTLVPNGYNISPKGGHGCKGCWSEESKNKIKGHPNWLKSQTPESRAKISKNNAKPMLGKHHTEESNEKNRQAHLGKESWNKGLKGAQVAWNKGLKGISEETRQKLRNAHKGKPHPNNRKSGYKHKAKVLMHVSS